MPATRWPDLDTMRQTGDPLADRAVEALFHSPRPDAVQNLLDTLILNDAPEPDQLPEELREYFHATDALIADAGREAHGGEQVFAEHGPEMLALLGCYSLPAAYAAKKGVQVIYRSAFLRERPLLRLFQTTQMVVDVMRPGGLAPGGRGARTLQKVRLMHAALRHVLRTDRELPWNDDWGVPINQEDLAATLMTFSWLIVDALDRLGIPMSEQERLDYLLAWNVAGRLVGVRDDLLPQTLDEARELTTLIQTRQIEASPEGAELTGTLVEALGRAMPPGFHHFPPALMRHLLPPAVSDGLGIPRRPFADVMTDLWARCSAVFDGIQDHDLRVRKGFRAFSVHLVQWMLKQNLGTRASFSVPLTLHGAWSATAADITPVLLGIDEHTRATAPASAAGASAPDAIPVTPRADEDDRDAGIAARDRVPLDRRVADYPLVTALLERRSRRFAAGATLDAPLAFTSRRQPRPLTLEQEATLAFAACGVTGPVIGDLAYRHDGNILVNFTGRTVASGDAIFPVAVFVTNDTGTWMLRRPQDLSADETRELVALARERRLAEAYLRLRIQTSTHRTMAPRRLPYVAPFNDWDEGIAGSTHFLPVVDLTPLYINVLLTALGPGMGLYIVDDRHGYRAAGLKRFTKSQGGQLHDNPKDGLFDSVTFLESDIYSLAMVEVGGILQNLALAAQALGLGGFPHEIAHPQWLQALGFDVVQVPFSKVIAAGWLKRTVIRLLGKDMPLPTAVGLKVDDISIFTPYCPPHYPSMREAVLAFVAHKFRAGTGTMRDGGAGTAWSKPADVQAGIPGYSDTAIDATIAYCEYVAGRYGRFPSMTGPIVSLTGYQAHHLDPDFYGAYYRPEALSETQRADSSA